MLELVVRKLRLLGEVTLGREVEIRLALLVVGEALLDDLPADRPSVFSGCERVAVPGRVGAQAPKDAQLLAAVRMAQPQAVARRLGHDARRRRVLDGVDEPV